MNSTKPLKHFSARLFKIRKKHVGFQSHEYGATVKVFFSLPRPTWHVSTAIWPSLSNDAHKWLPGLKFLSIVSLSVNQSKALKSLSKVKLEIWIWKSIWWWQWFWWHRYVGDFFRYVCDLSNVLNRPQTSQTCHQHIWSPTSVTNINVTHLIIYL